MSVIYLKIGGSHLELKYRVEAINAWLIGVQLVWVKSQLFLDGKGALWQWH